MQEITPILATKNTPPKSYTKCSLYSELGIGYVYFAMNEALTISHFIKALWSSKWAICQPSAAVAGFLTLYLHWQEREGPWKQPCLLALGQGHSLITWAYRSRSSQCLRKKADALFFAPIFHTKWWAAFGVQTLEKKSLLFVFRPFKNDKLVRAYTLKKLRETILLEKDAADKVAIIYCTAISDLCTYALHAVTAGTCIQILDWNVLDGPHL